MSLFTRKQIKDNVIAITKQDSTQIGSLVNDFINLTLREINNPGWASPGNNHLWSFLRRKSTFSASSEDTVLERDVDKIALIRYTTNPIKLTRVPDEMFYRYIPNPTQTGSPKYYREWAIDGLSTKLASADKLDILSSSSSDGSTFTVTIVGYVSGRLTAESYTLNGTSVVSGSNTWDAREIFVSKSGATTGNITVRRNSNSATVLTLGAQETSPRFKVVSLYPIPSSALTLNIEYYRAIRDLYNDTDTPDIPEKFQSAIVAGTICKILQYLGRSEDYVTNYTLFKNAVLAMIASDKVQPDLIEYMGKRNFNPSFVGRQELEKTVS